MSSIAGQPAAGPFQVMSKPIGPRCNLACTYCYYLEKERLYPREQKFRMSDAVLERFIADYIAAQDAAGVPEIWFAWQGGEPTLLGLDYFARIVALQEKHRPAGKTIRNSLQTNGTLLTVQWARFLRQHDFLLGLSIDGPPSLHDQHRRDRRGQPTSGRVMAALDLLRAQRVEFNVLVTVNHDNVSRPLELYRFLRECGVTFMQFIPVVERSGPQGCLAGPAEGGAEQPSMQVTPWSVRPLEYGDFLCTIFDEWVRHDVGRVFVQLFDVQLGLWLGGPAALCIFAQTCGRGLALEHNGDLYACDHYVYPEYRLGNIMQQPLGQLAASAALRRFGEDKRASLPRRCQQCEYRFACNGGCPKHRFLASEASGEQGLNYFCAAYRRFFTHAGPLLDTMAHFIRHGRPAAAIMPLLAARRSDSAAALERPCPCGSGRPRKQCCVPAPTDPGRGSALN